MCFRLGKLHRTILFSHQLFYVLKGNALLLCFKTRNNTFWMKEFLPIFHQRGDELARWLNTGWTFPLRAFNFHHLFVSASRAPPAQNGAASYGYPSPGMMNGYGPPPTAPPSYAYPAPGRQNGFYQVQPPVAGNMGYPYPTATAGRGFSHAQLDIYRSTFTQL